MKVAWHLLPRGLNEACMRAWACVCGHVCVCTCVCGLIKERVRRDDASLPLLCDEKLRESWANRSGFSSFSSLTLIQKQFSAISWGTICNDTRIPLSAQSETAIPPTCHSKSSSALRQPALQWLQGHTGATRVVFSHLRSEWETRKKGEKKVDI